jgi:hypothetical protein
VAIGPFVMLLMPVLWFGVGLAFCRLCGDRSAGLVLTLAAFLLILVALLDAQVTQLLDSPPVLVGVATAVAAGSGWVLRERHVSLTPGGSR